MEYVDALEATESQGGMILAFLFGWDERTSAIQTQFDKISVEF